MDNACFQLLRNHQNPWKSIKHGSTGSPKKVPKTASIECCARPLVPQVMKVCFILVLGHRYETCTLVFYRGVFKKKTVAQSALMPHYSIEKMVSKKTCAPPFYRGITWYYSTCCHATCFKHAFWYILWMLYNTSYLPTQQTLWPCVTCALDDLIILNTMRCAILADNASGGTSYCCNKHF